VIRAEKVLPAEDWSHAASDTVVLDFDRRHRRRIVMKAEKGLEFLLDLAGTAALKDGDRIVLEDGRIVEVKAADEPLVEVTAADPAHLVRLAWHLGNRHLPAALTGNRLFIRRDHVIEEMLERLGAIVRHVEAPFDPEAGAYAHHHGHHSRG
jgi:urease accessory protein